MKFPIPSIALGLLSIGTLAAAHGKDPCTDFSTPPSCGCNAPQRFPGFNAVPDTSVSFDKVTYDEITKLYDLTISFSVDAFKKIDKSYLSSIYITDIEGSSTPVSVFDKSANIDEIDSCDRFSTTIKILGTESGDYITPGSFHVKYNFEKNVKSCGFWGSGFGENFGFDFEGSCHSNSNNFPLKRWKKSCCSPHTSSSSSPTVVSTSSTSVSVPTIPSTVVSSSLISSTSASVPTIPSTVVSSSAPPSSSPSGYGPSGPCVVVYETVTVTPDPVIVTVTANGNYLPYY